MADDKKDANSQRGANAPQPRTREEGASLSDVVDKLKDNNQEQTKTTEATTGLVANMMNIANSVERVGLAGNAVLDTVADKLSGNKLKELESNKEDAQRDDKTNELLEELVDNTDQDLLESPKGFFGAVLATVAAVTGTLAGILGGFAVGLFESTKLLGAAFKTFGSKLFRSFDDLFNNKISKSFGKLKSIFQVRLIDPINDFFKGIRTAFRFGNKGMKTFKAGLVKDVANFFGRQARTLRLAAGEMDVVKNLKFIKASVSTFFGNIGGAVRSFGTKFAKLFDLGDDLKKAQGSLTSIGKSISGFIRPFTKTADAAKNTGKFAMMIIRPFKMFSEFFKFFAAKFLPVGKVLGKLFLPVTIIMGIFDGIRGAITGASEEEGMANKFIGGIFGAISGILVGLVGIPLDLLKDLVGWIAGKLGFENASEALGKFSFSGLISNIIDTIRDFFGGVVDFVVGLFTFDGEKMMGGFTAMKDAIGNVLKPLLRSILPDPKAELFSIAGIASKAIPSFIYDYAGINKATGEMEPLENSIFNTVKDTGEKLNAGSIENESNKNKSAGVTANTSVDNSTKSSSAQTINIMGGQPLATANELRFQA
jgi:hypothetical protein